MKDIKINHHSEELLFVATVYITGLLVDFTALVKLTSGQKAAADEANLVSATRDFKADSDDGGATRQ